MSETLPRGTSGSSLNDLSVLVSLFSNFVRGCVRSVRRLVMQLLDNVKSAQIVVCSFLALQDLPIHITAPVHLFYSPAHSQPCLCIGLVSGLVSNYVAGFI